MAWHDLDPMHNGDVIRYTEINQWKDNEDYLKDKLEDNDYHTYSDGTHSWDDIGYMPARLFGTFDKNLLIKTNAFNAGVYVISNGTGEYTIGVLSAFSGTNDYSVFATLISEDISGYSNRPIVRVKARTTSSFTLALTDAATAVDMGDDEFISFVVFKE